MLGEARSRLSECGGCNHESNGAGFLRITRRHNRRISPVPGDTRHDRNSPIHGLNDGREHAGSFCIRQLVDFPRYPEDRDPVDACFQRRQREPAQACLVNGSIREERSREDGVDAP